MPKSYSEDERALIINKLKEEAGKCLIQYGIKRTTVDEIVKRVRIPKGTFYLFYKSKELLLFDVILEQHNLVEEKMLLLINSVDQSSINAEHLTNLILKFFQLTDETPLLKILHSDEIEIIKQKLPVDILAEHLSHDNAVFEQLFSILPLKTDMSFEVLTSTFRAIHFISLKKNEIGEINYDEVLRSLIYGIVIQII